MGERSTRFTSPVVRLVFARNGMAGAGFDLPGARRATTARSVV